MKDNVEKMVDKMTGKSSLNMLSAFGAMLDIAGLEMMIGKPKKPKEVEGRPCLNCGKLKYHNNGFCSGECCKEHKVKIKNNYLT